MIEDEKKASKTYKQYGMKGLSKDEARHKTFLEWELYRLKHGLPLKMKRKLKKVV
jgi:hypothetical protein